MGPEIILVHGLVKLVPAVAYHFCLNLPAIFSQPRTSIISGPSTCSIQEFPSEHLWLSLIRSFIHACIDNVVLSVLLVQLLPVVLVHTLVFPSLLEQTSHRPNV